MRYKNINRPLGLSTSGPQQKCIAWLPIMEMATNLFKGVMNWGASEDANETNWHIAKLNYKLGQETNEKNYQIAQETNVANAQSVKDTNRVNQQISSAYNANQVQLQNDMNDYNYKMWELNNQYNSPANQLKLAKQAGVNANMAFGITPASSPVQQTSLPNQSVAYEQAPEAKMFQYMLNKYDFKKEPNKAIASMFSELGDILANLPQFDNLNKDTALKQANARLTNANAEAQELANDATREANKYYASGLALIQNTKDPSDIITFEKFNGLSDKEKENYVVQNYVKENGIDVATTVPNLLKLNIKSRAGYEAFKDMRNLPNFIQNIETDKIQSKLRALIADKQINDKGSDGKPSVLYTIAHAPQLQFMKLNQEYEKIMKDMHFEDETFADRIEIIASNAKKLKNELDHDLFTWIDKLSSESDMSVTDYFKLLLLSFAQLRK